MRSAGPAPCISSSARRFRARYRSLKGLYLRVSSRHKSSNRRLCARRHIEPPLRGRLCCDGLTSNHAELLALIRRAGLQLADYSVRNADHFWARSSTPLDQNRIKIANFSSKIANNLRKLDQKQVVYQKFRLASRSVPENFL